MDGLKSCKDRGLCESVGVKGVEGRGVEKVVKLFEKKGLKMDTLEVSFSLVNRRAMFDGTLDACKRNGVTCLATLPLGLDEIGSGKYTAMNPTGGEMGKPRFTFKEVRLYRLVSLSRSEVMGQGLEIGAISRRFAFNYSACLFK